LKRLKELKMGWEKKFGVEVGCFRSRDIVVVLLSTTPIN